MWSVTASPGPGSCGQRARRTMGDIADAMHVDDAMILADLVERALQLADHIEPRIIDGCPGR